MPVAPVQSAALFLSSCASLKLGKLQFLRRSTNRFFVGISSLLVSVQSALLFLSSCASLKLGKLQFLRRSTNRFFVGISSLLVSMQSASLFLYPGDFHCFLCIGKMKFYKSRKAFGPFFNNQACCCFIYCGACTFWNRETS